MHVTPFRRVHRRFRNRLPIDSLYNIDFSIYWPIRFLFLLGVVYVSIQLYFVSQSKKKETKLWIEQSQTRLTSVNQNAGQVEHPAGMCLRSNINKPLLNRRSPSNLTEFLGPSAVGEVDMYTNGSFVC